MTPEQLELLTIAASSHDLSFFEEQSAIDAARRDLAAMRQPITAEALTAAGWVKRSPNTDYWWSKDGVSITNDKGAGGKGRWSFYTQDDRSGLTRAHPTNMYALDQLAELLGGGK